VRKKWSVLKTKVNPGLLHGHSASKVMGSMIIFGGKKGGQISNDLWKFYFGNKLYGLRIMHVRIYVYYIIGSKLTVKEVGSCWGCEKLKKKTFFSFISSEHCIKYYDLRSTKEVNKILYLVEYGINFDSLSQRVFRLTCYET